MTQSQKRKWPYIKPTRFKHDSGFRCFEIGYCEIDDDSNAINIENIGSCSDHIWLSNIMDKNIDLNIDLTKNGYIRIYSLDELKWRHNIPTSTATITKKETNDTITKND